MKEKDGKGESYQDDPFYAVYFTKIKRNFKF
jgi:hypothetical protein